MALWYRDKELSGTQFEIMSHDLCIGHISKNIFTGHKDAFWRWTFGLSARPPGFAILGRADTLEEAKVDVERNWQLWLAAAGLNDAGTN